MADSAMALHRFAK